MSNFCEKAIFVWLDQNLAQSEQAAEIIAAAGFEAVYLHSTNVGNWRTASRVALAAALKRRGLRVYASAAVYGDKVTYGYSPSEEGHGAAAIVNQYMLDGFIFDVEKGLYETSALAPSLIRDMFAAYAQMSPQPTAFCGWAFYDGYHQTGVLIEAMKHATVGMPMAYWYNGSSPAAALATLEGSWQQWRKYTSKPLVMAGRAYNDSYRTSDGQTISITARADAILAYAARARALGAVGVSWWVAELAYKLPAVWEALTQTPKMGEPGNGDTEMPNPWKDKALLYYAKTDADAGWSNTAFAGFVGHGITLDGVEDPNPLLKPMQLKAAELGKPFIIAADFTVKYYTANQTPMQEDLWPPLSLDYPLQQLIEIIAAREYAEIWINFTDPRDHTGEPCDPDWLDYGLRMFLAKLSDWKRANKPNAKVRVMTSFAFLKAYSPATISRIDNYLNGVKQPLALAHDASYPNEAEKPAWLGNEEPGPFWWYLERLILFTKGGAAELALELGAAVPDPGGDPGDGDTGGSVDLKAVLAALARLEAGQAAQGAQIAEIRSKFS